MSSTEPEPSIQALSLASINECKFGFVSEGGANVVFEVLVEPGSEYSSIFQGQLLRVPKAGTKAHSYSELQEYWETIVRPLFRPEDLVQQRLIKLEGRELAARLNHVLEREEASRRADFKGSRVAETEYGMLVEDMRKRSPDDVTLEFKPKWLAQSPNAPASATRCRNCAREVLRHDTRPTSSSSGSSSGSGSGSGSGGGGGGGGGRRPKRILCPLDFLACAGSPAAVANILSHFAADLDPPIRRGETARLPAPYDRLAGWLRTNDLLPRLRAAQLANDRGGPLSVASASNDDDDDDDDDNLSGAGRFQLAMTLRDCACFLRVPADPGSPVEAKLGDLDKKNGAAKLGYWQRIETRLIEGGYYAGREVEGVEVNCRLGRDAEVAYREGGMGSI
ncbi:inositol-pentakisphosphate 2-kinase [Thermothelomyces heterothallicus CBS 202.75]|uniref:inositol-pentakisphosphate 2-kinase n=1 Tax=Thermothelomyces heterothallicus CBS 202.75 TaxID=1149848 RepID=UPI00374220E8